MSGESKVTMQELWGMEWESAFCEAQNITKTAERFTDKLYIAAPSINRVDLELIDELEDALNTLKLHMKRLENGVTFLAQTQRVLQKRKEMRDAKQGS